MSIYSSTCETCSALNRNHKKHVYGDQNTNEFDSELSHMKYVLKTGKTMKKFLLNAISITVFEENYLCLKTETGAISTSVQHYATIVGQENSAEDEIILVNHSNMPLTCNVDDFFSRFYQYLIL